MAVPQGGFSAIRQEDLKDPTLYALNAKLQFLYGQVAVLTSGASWKIYSPTVTASGTMTASALLVKQASYLQETHRLTFLLDLSFTVGGTLDTTFYITLPTPPVSFTARYACAAALYIPNATGAVASIYNNQVQVSQYNHANFAAGACEVVVSGVYQI